MAKQHVALYRKQLLRDRLLRWAAPGAVYVPFIGDGDLAVAHYADRRIFGADIDRARVDVAQARLHDAVVVVGDCDSWPLVGQSTPRFAVADFDAYTYPYDSFRAFWTNAQLAQRLVMFFTDTVKQAVKRSGHVREPDGTHYFLPDVVSGSRERSDVYNKWFSKHIWPWFEDAIAPYKVLDRMRYLRQDTVYWGAVIDRRQTKLDYYISSNV